MKWEDVRTQYPNKWILAEAVVARNSKDDKERNVDQWAVLDVFPEYIQAVTSYKKYHRQYPQRELYVTHTANEKVQIKVRRWLGVRSVQQTGTVIDFATMEIYAERN